MIWLGIAGAVCVLAAVVAVSSAGRASGAASRSTRSEIGARSASADAEVSARVARTVTGVDYSFDRDEAAALDPSHRLWQDMRAGAAVAQRLDYRTRSARTAGHRAPDVFVKSNPRQPNGAGL